MTWKKYVEIEWTEIRLSSINVAKEGQLLLYISTDYPVSCTNYNVSEKLISGLQQKSQNNLCLKPKREHDRILFSGYARNFLQLAISILSWDREPMPGYKQPSLFELLSWKETFSLNGLAKFLFSGAIDLFEVDAILGSLFLQLRRHTPLPLTKPIVGELLRGDTKIGEIDINVYLDPGDPISLHRDVVIFRLSPREIAVYYSGDLAEASELYMVWTTNNWKSNPLVKMKRLAKSWMAIIDTPGEDMQQLELSFTNAEGDWDNRDGSNWVFNSCSWL